MVSHMVSLLALLSKLVEPVKISYHSTKFGGHGHSGGGNKMFLVCHVILT